MKLKLWVLVLYETYLYELPFAQVNLYQGMDNLAGPVVRKLGFEGEDPASRPGTDQFRNL